MTEILPDLRADLEGWLARLPELPVAHDRLTSGERILDPAAWKQTVGREGAWCLAQWGRPRSWVRAAALIRQMSAVSLDAGIFYDRPAAQEFSRARERGKLVPLPARAPASPRGILG